MREYSRSSQLRLAFGGSKWESWAKFALCARLIRALRKRKYRLRREWESSWERSDWRKTSGWIWIKFGLAAVLPAAKARLKVKPELVCKTGGHQNQVFFSVLHLRLYSEPWKLPPKVYLAEKANSRGGSGAEERATRIHELEWFVLCQWRLRIRLSLPNRVLAKIKLKPVDDEYYFVCGLQREQQWHFVHFASG